MLYNFFTFVTISFCLKWVWRYQRDNRNPFIQEEQTTQLLLLKSKYVWCVYKLFYIWVCGSNNKGIHKVVYNMYIYLYNFKRRSQCTHVQHAISLFVCVGQIHGLTWPKPTLATLLVMLFRNSIVKTRCLKHVIYQYLNWCTLSKDIFCLQFACCLFHADCYGSLF